MPKNKSRRMSGKDYVGLMYLADALDRWSPESYSSNARLRDRRSSVSSARPERLSLVRMSDANVSQRRQHQIESAQRIDEITDSVSQIVEHRKLLANLMRRGASPRMVRRVYDRVRRATDRFNHDFLHAGAHVIIDPNDVSDSSEFRPVEFPKSSTYRKFNVVDLNRDIQAMRSGSEFDTVKFDYRTKELVVRTNPITLEYNGTVVEFPHFDIRLRLDQLYLHQGYKAVFRITTDSPVTPVSHRHSSNYIHPHVDREILCAGDASGSLTNALHEGNIFDFFFIIKATLEVYNPESPYVKLDDWYGPSCADCGAHGRDVRMYTCYHSGQPVCSSCVVPAISGYNEEDEEEHYTDHYLAEYVHTCPNCGETVGEGMLYRSRGEAYGCEICDASGPGRITDHENVPRILPLPQGWRPEGGVRMIIMGNVFEFCGNLPFMVYQGSCTDRDYRSLRDMSNDYPIWAWENRWPSVDAVIARSIGNAATGAAAVPANTFGAASDTPAGGSNVDMSNMYRWTPQDIHAYRTQHDEAPSAEAPEQGESPQTEPTPTIFGAADDSSPPSAASAVSHSISNHLRRASAGLAASRAGQAGPSSRVADFSHAHSEVSQRANFQRLAETFQVTGDIPEPPTVVNIGPSSGFFVTEGLIRPDPQPAVFGAEDRPRPVENVSPETFGAPGEDPEDGEH